MFWNKRIKELEFKVDFQNSEIKIIKELLNEWKAKNEILELRCESLEERADELEDIDNDIDNDINRIYE